MTSQNNKIINIAILASGTGSNALNIIEYVKRSCPSLSIKVLICDIENAEVIERAKEKQIDVRVISLSTNKEIPFAQRKIEQENKVIKVIQSESIDWILLAGYMKLFSGNFIDTFTKKDRKNANIVNIHPSRLPAFPGLNAYERAYDAQSKLNGATVHFVDKGMDTGTIIMQSSFDRVDDMSFEDFEACGLKLEHELYMSFLKLLNINEEEIYKIIK